MWSLTIRIVIGLLLIIHGFAHWQITTGWGQQVKASSWLLDGLGASAVRTTGNLLWILALLIFLIAGFAIIMGQDWWRPLAIVAAAVSLLLIVLYWQPAMVLGAAVDAAILIALLWAHWPAPETIGA